MVTAGGLLIKNNQIKKKWKYQPYLPFEMLRKRWRFFLISELKKAIKKQLKKNSKNTSLSVFTQRGVLDSFFQGDFSKNFYVYDSKELDYENFTVKYIGRYTKRPPLGETRIVHYGKIENYDGFWVSFLFKERTQPTVKLSLPVDKFIELLVQHILPDNFRAIRYYGALANRVKGKFKKLIPESLKRTQKTLEVLPWRERQKLYLHSDPLLCPKCKKEMKLVEIATFSPKTNSLTHFYPP